MDARPFLLWVCHVSRPLFGSAEATRYSDSMSVPTRT